MVGLSLFQLQFQILSLLRQSIYLFQEAALISLYLSTLLLELSAKAKLSVNVHISQD